MNELEILTQYRDILRRQIESNDNVYDLCVELGDTAFRIKQLERYV